MPNNYDLNKNSTLLENAYNLMIQKMSTQKTNAQDLETRIVNACKQLEENRTTLTFAKAMVEDCEATIQALECELENLLSDAQRKGILELMPAIKEVLDKNIEEQAEVIEEQMSRMIEDVPVEDIPIYNIDKIELEELIKLKVKLSIELDDLIDERTILQMKKRSREEDDRYKKITYELKAKKEELDECDIKLQDILNNL
jgi:hypothetical protein